METLMGNTGHAARYITNPRPGFDDHYAHRNRRFHLAVRVNSARFDRNIENRRQSDRHDRGDKIFYQIRRSHRSTDSSSAFLTSKADFPLALRGGSDANGDGRATARGAVQQDAVRASRFTSVLFPRYVFSTNGKTGMGACGSMAQWFSVSFAQPFAQNTTAFSGQPQGSGVSYFTVQNIPKKNIFPVADSIGPIITSAQVVERPGPGIDTIYVAFSEDVEQQAWSGPP